MAGTIVRAAVLAHLSGGVLSDAPRASCLAEHTSGACAASGTPGDEGTSLLQTLGRDAWGSCSRWIGAVPKCLNSTAQALATALPNVSRWDNGDDEGFSGVTVDNGDSDMYDDGNMVSFSVEGLGWSRAVEYTQQCDGSWTSSGHGDVEYFTCRVDVENTANLEDGNRSTVWFAGLRSRSGSLNGFKVGGELGSDRNSNAFGAVGRTPSARDGFFGYYSQTLSTSDPSVNHLVIVPDCDWVSEYTTTPELGAEGDIYVPRGGRKHAVKRGAPVNALFYIAWGGNDQGIPGSNNTVYSPADFQKALDSVATSC